MGLQRKLTGTSWQIAAYVVAETKSLVWEKFGELVEQDFWSALKQFWQTTRWHKRKVVLYLSIGVLLTSAEGTVGILQGSPQSQWQCLEKAESGDDGDNLLIIRSEVIEAGKQLLGGRISGEGSVNLWTLWGFLGWHPPATSHTDLGQCLWTGRLGWMFPSLKRLTRRCTQIAGGSHYSDSKGRCTSTYKRGDYVLNLGFRRNKAVFFLVMDLWTLWVVLEFPSQSTSALWTCGLYSVTCVNAVK